MIQTAPARDKEDERMMLVRLIQDTFANQLVLGDIHAPMNKVSDLFKVTEGDEIISGWSVFHGFGRPVVVFPAREYLAWNSIKRMVEMLGYPEFILPFPVDMEEDHGYRPWDDWPQFSFKLQNRDKAMRIETKDIEVRDISDLPTIRAATADDIPKLEQFYKVAETRGEFGGTFHPLQLRSDNYVVCVDNGEIVGTAGTHFETPYTVQLGNIYVLPEYRGRGIGRALTTAVVLGSIKTQRVPTLFVNEKNMKARKLYESIGFEYFLDYEFYQVTRQ